MAAGRADRYVSEGMGFLLEVATAVLVPLAVVVLIALPDLREFRLTTPRAILGAVLLLGTWGLLAFRMKWIRRKFHAGWAVGLTPTRLLVLPWRADPRSRERLTSLGRDRLPPVRVAGYSRTHRRSMLPAASGFVVRIEAPRGRLTLDFPHGYEPSRMPLGEIARALGHEDLFTRSRRAPPRRSGLRP